MVGNTLKTTTIIFFLVDLLFIELMSHLSHVKQMNSQSIHLKHELILCLQITRGRVHLNGDSTAKHPCWHQVLNLWPSLICSRTFLTGFCHFHGSTRSGTTTRIIIILQSFLGHGFKFGETCSGSLRRIHLGSSLLIPRFFFTSTSLER